MYKVAVMGDYDSIYGFAAVGLTIFPVDGLTDDQIARLIRQTSEGCGILYMTESLMERMKDELVKYQDRITPAIIAIPGVSNNTGIGIRNVKKSVEQAVGSDILFENK